MAEGRLVTRSVATDERLNAMSRDAMLLYLMTVPHLDRDGLIDGRPRVLWAAVAPLQDEWLHCADALVDEWVASGLAVRYFDEGRPVLFFTGFAKDQEHMRYDRERASKFACPPGYVRTPVGLRPAPAVAQGDDGPARDELTPGARADQEQVRSSSGVGPAEDQDQAEVQDQAQDQAEDEDQHQHQSPTGVGGGDDFLSLSSPGCDRAGLTGAGSAGELVACFSVQELRTAAYQLGSLLGLHTDWAGYEGFIGRREAGSLGVLLEWIEFYRAMPPPTLEKIENMPGLIRSHLNKGNRAPLSGAQRRALAAAVEVALAVAQGSA